MQIHRAGSRPSAVGPAEWFTGRVRIDPLFADEPLSRMAGNLVTFEPEARTHWHAHPLGQVLLIVQGLGRVQREGGPVAEVRPGDVVRFGPGERHRRGAAPEAAMSHVAIQEADAGGSPVAWMGAVDDAEYRGRP